MAADPEEERKMQDVLNTAIETWKVYWGVGYLGYVSAACYVILVILSIHKKKLRSIVFLSGILAVLFFFPYTQHLLMRMVEDTYWRALWTIPFIMIIAIVFTTAASCTKKKWVQFCILAAAVLTIAFSGSTLVSSERFVRMHNPERVPDEIVSIAEFLKEEDVNPKKRFIAANSAVAPYLRVYDPSFQLAFGRLGEGAYNVNRQLLSPLIDYVDGSNMKTIAELANMEKITHIVMDRTDTEWDGVMLEEGWERAADIEGYVIYRKTGLK